MVVARYRDVGHGDIYLGEYGGRAMERVTRLDNWVVGLDWLPDHRHVVFGGTTEKAVGMQMLDTVTREVRLLPSTSVGSQYPVASEMADGRVRIVFVKESQGIDVETYGADGKLAYRIHQRAQEENPTLGDSGRLIYVSDRDGGFDLWTCQRPCAESRRITNHKEKTSEMAPHISPDERTVAYVHAEEGKQEVRTAAVEGGESRVLYAGPVAAAPSWSCDGKRVYFRAMAAGRAEIWSIDAAGETAPAQETRGGAGYAYASRDCRYLYYSGSGEGSWIVRRELATGQEQRLAHPATLRGDRWRVGGNAVHFLDMEESGGRYSMKRVSPEAAPQTVMTIGAGVEAYSFAANARGEVALCFRGQAMADIYYVDVKKERRSGLGF
jgi:Tol biopolymer transport system component